MFLVLYPLSQALRYITGAQGDTEDEVETTADDIDNNTHDPVVVNGEVIKTMNGPVNRINANTVINGDSESSTPARMVEARNHLFCIDSVENSECNTPEHRCSAAHQAYTQLN